MEGLDGGFLASSQRIEYTGIKTLRCLTIKQVNSIPLDESSSILICDRFEVSNLQIAGYISSVRKISSGYVFEVDDTTGKLDCAFWVNGSFEELISERILENNLVRITGSLKTFGNKKTLNASNITIISTAILVYHLTSCLYQHLYFTGKMEKSDEKKGNVLSLSKIQTEILEVYRNNQDNDGLDLEIVVAMLKDKYTENDIRNNVYGLLNNCHLYSVEGTSYKTTI